APELGYKHRKGYDYIGLKDDTIYIIEVKRIGDVSFTGTEKAVKDKEPNYVVLIYYPERNEFSLFSGKDIVLNDTPSYVAYVASKSDNHRIYVKDGSLTENRTRERCPQ